MTEAQAQLVFYGQVLDGYDASAVRRSVGEHLQLDRARLDHLFSGQRVVLKRAVEPDRAVRHAKQFARLGARLHVEPAGGVAAGPAAKGTGAASSRAATAAAPARAAAPAVPVRSGPAAAVAAPAPSTASAPVASMSLPVLRDPPTPAARPAPAASPPAAPLPPPLPAAQPQPRATVPASRPGAAAPSTMPGGLSLAPLDTGAAAAEETIDCPNCGERQPRAVFCRSCVTNMPMGLAARAEAEAAARAERAPAGSGRRAPVPAGMEPAHSGGTPALLGLGFQGRMARSPYAAASSVSMLAGSGVLWWLASAPGTARLVVTGLVWLVLCVYGTRLCVLRWHDCNRSGWWSLLLAVPVLGWVAALALSLLRGTEGDNAYGPPPDAHNAPLMLGVAAAATLVVAVGVKPALAGLEHDDEAASPMGGEATRVFASEYAAAPGHKAFAVSGQAWGWKGGMATEDEAVTAALAYCEASRPAEAPPCELISVDGSGLPGAQR